ncbi:MAG TPA: peptidase M17 [Spirochaetia bacterium]|nr:peptidase M17 [Spirochaetia bacterium]
MQKREAPFQSFVQIDSELLDAARVAVSQVLNVTQRETVLIVTNPDAEVHAISLALYDAVREVDAIPILAVQPTKGQLDFTEDAVRGAIRSKPDVLISMSAVKLGQDKETIAEPLEHEGVSYDNYFHYLLHGVQTTRSFWSPGVTRDIFMRTVPISYRKLKSECSMVRGYLDDAVEVHITTKIGTDLTIGLRNRSAKVDDGDFSRPGQGGNLPAGEAFISPELGTATGIILFDGSISLHDRDTVINTPIRAEVDKGMVTAVSGGIEAQHLNETLALGEANALLFEEQGRLPKGLGQTYRRNARNLGELGIGLNPAAKITGNMLEDEKVYRTCHIAIGRNYDEDAPALIHLDGLIREPTITTFLASGERRVILKDGELV